MTEEKGGWGGITCTAVSSPFPSILKKPQRAENPDITTNFCISVFVLYNVAEGGKSSSVPQIYCSTITSSYQQQSYFWGS